MTRGETPPGPGADPRVPLAAERTLLAWIRTGLAMMGFGFVVARFGLFLRELAASRGVDGPAANFPPHHGRVSLWVGTALVALGVVVNVLATAQHARFLRRLRRGEPPGGAFPLGIAVSLLLAALGLFMAVYLVVVG